MLDCSHLAEGMAHHRRHRTGCSLGALEAAHTMGTVQNLMHHMAEAFPPDKLDRVMELQQKGLGAQGVQRLEKSLVEVVSVEEPSSLLR